MQWYDEVLQVLLIGIANGAIIALIALGYTLVYGIIELINFAHGDVFMIGTMVSLTLITWIPGLLGVRQALQLPPLTVFLLIVGSLLASILVCAALNVAIERVAYRRLRNAPRLAPLITAIGMSFVLQNLIGVFFGFDYKSSNSPLPTGTIFHIGNQTYGWDKLIVLIVTVPVLLALVWLVTTTRWGKAMRAT